MTKAQIKEKISQHFIGILAAKQGFKIVFPNEDHGVDFIIKKVEQYKMGKRTRYVDSGNMVGVQLKCVTQKQTVTTDGFLKLDLAAKNFHDLNWRMENRKSAKGVHIPLALVVVVVPNAEKQWVNFSVDFEKLILTGKAFWWYPDGSEKETKNVSSNRIAIPLEQQIKLDFFENIFNLLTDKSI